MQIPVFLSYSTPYSKEQEGFIETLKQTLETHCLYPRTLGVTDYDLEEPLVAVRRMMLECNGLITIAFRRFEIQAGTEHKKGAGKTLNGQYFTSPWCHIEPAMAYQLGLPILVFREKGVTANGILEKGVAGVYLPEFDLEDKNSYFDRDEAKEILGVWEGYVRAFNRAKGRPPRLF